MPSGHLFQAVSPSASESLPRLPRGECREVSLRIDVVLEGSDLRFLTSFGITMAWRRPHEGMKMAALHRSGVGWSPRAEDGFPPSRERRVGRRGGYFHSNDRSECRNDRSECAAPSSLVRPVPSCHGYPSFQDFRPQGRGHRLTGKLDKALRRTQVSEESRPIRDSISSRNEGCQGVIDMVVERI